MDASEVTPYLPPIAVSAGAMLPVLISKPPFSVAENARVLLACLMALLVWLAYWAVYLPASLLFFWTFLSPLMLALSLGAMAVVFWAASRPPEVPAEGQAALREIDKPRYLFWYAFGLFCIAVVAALYAGPKGQVVVELEIKLPEGPKPVVTTVSRDAGAQDQIPIAFNVSGDGRLVTLLVDQTEFNDTKDFVVDGTTDPKNSKAAFTLHATKGQRTKVFRPDMVIAYRIPAAPNSEKPDPANTSNQP